MSLLERNIPDLEALNSVARELEHQPASAAVRWAAEEFGDALVLAASFQDSVLIDIVARVAPDVEVVFLDTQYHFAQTLWYVEQVRQRYDLNLRIVEPLVEPDDLWQTDLDGCCALRKVEPLNRALDGKRGWMSGLRRSESPSRAKAPVITWDLGRGLVKVNPLAAWNDADVDGYTREHNLLVHPLAEQGYKSIGCWPCTRAVGDGEDARAGRWAGSDKTECGLHA
jgi:phosphoadenosine phosphosulfate reductase